MYYPIDETTARRAHEMMSMRDYTPGSTTAEYRRMVDQAAALVERQKQKVSPFYHDKLDALLDRYARPHRDYFDWHAPCGGGFVLEGQKVIGEVHD